jgi:transposase
MKKIVAKKQTLEITDSLIAVNPHAAGIDIGSTFHVVAIGQLPHQIRQFGVYTEDLEELAQWLLKSQITTVAMESTGTYWKSLFQTLCKHGLEICLTSGKFTRNVRGRKSDVIDAAWIQKLHTFGLLPSSFLPSEFSDVLRTLTRHRKGIVENLSLATVQMQADLRGMNLRLDVVLNDIMGMSGKNIIEAILKGERNPSKLADLAHHCCKKPKEEICAALLGNWKNEYLFSLKQHLASYDFYLKALAETDKEIEKIIKDELTKQGFDNDNLDLPKTPAKRSHKNAPKMPLEVYAFNILGTDLTQIPAVGNDLVLTFLAEIGNDIDKFPSEKAFAYWLGLTPKPKMSGGKIISNRTPKRQSYLADALRHSANVIGNLKGNPLSAFFKRIAFKSSRIQAITATAHKLAVIIYQMVKKKEPYQYMTQDEYQNRIRNHKLNYLQKIVKEFGFSPQEVNFAFNG